MSGPSAEAIAQLRRTAEGGRDPQAWARYIAALTEAGQKGRARKAAKAAPFGGDTKTALVAMSEKGPVRAGAPLKDLAGLIRSGQAARARRLGHDLLTQFPEDARLLNVLGVLALSTDDPIEAEILLRRAMDADATNADARTNLGLALVRQGRGRAAVDILTPLATGPGATLAARVNLASAHLRAEDPESALALTVEILKDHPEDPETRAIRAQAQLALGQGAAALETLTPLQDAPGFDLHDLVADALERTEGRATALHYIEAHSEMPLATRKRTASLLGEWGELEIALVHARALAEAAPEDPTGVRLIGLYGRWEAEDALIGEMERALADTSLPAVRRGSFGLALAKARMDLGEHEAAFKALSEGNAHLRSLVTYDVARDEARMQDIARRWTPAVIADLQDGDAPSLAPVFIVGLPRSGSTLIETILSRHPSVTPLGESPRTHAAVSAVRNAADPHAIRAIRKSVSPVLSPLRPDGAVTDKLLANFLYLGALAAAFPKARFIEARRDFRATGLSIFQTELAPVAHPYSMDLEEIARYAIAYDRLMSHWSYALGDRLYRADYERLVSNPAGEIPKLVAAAGLPWDDACLGQTMPERRINTFSVAQARKPITTKSVARWTRYEGHLKPMIDILKNEGMIDG